MRLYVNGEWIEATPEQPIMVELDERDYLNLFQARLSYRLATRFAQFHHDDPYHWTNERKKEFLQAGDKEILHQVSQHREFPPKHSISEDVPSDGSYDFATGKVTPPSGWSTSPDYKLPEEYKYKKTALTTTEHGQVEIATQAEVEEMMREPQTASPGKLTGLNLIKSLDAWL